MHRLSSAWDFVASVGVDWLDGGCCFGTFVFEGGVCWAGLLDCCCDDSRNGVDNVLLVAVVFWMMYFARGALGPLSCVLASPVVVPP